MSIKSCEVTEQEIVAEVADNVRQATLQVLKRKGAPINGCIVLEPDPGYIWAVSEIGQGSKLVAWSPNIEITV